MENDYKRWVLFFSGLIDYYDEMLNEIIRYTIHVYSGICMTTKKYAVPLEIRDAFLSTFIQFAFTAFHLLILHTILSHFKNF